jgi:hypothetical protein
MLCRKGNKVFKGQSKKLSDILLLPFPPAIARIYDVDFGVKNICAFGPISLVMWHVSKMHILTTLHEYHIKGGEGVGMEL